jgi:hypothetical protein
MSSPATPRNPREGGGGPVDSEIGLRAILLFGAGLAILSLLVSAAMWALTIHYRNSSIARDPRPSPLAEARERRLPPEPRLQPFPTTDMVALREREDAALHGYGWADQRAGIARIPVDRAVAILLEKGLPEIKAKPRTAPAGEAAAGAPGAPGATPSSAPAGAAARRGRSAVPSAPHREGGTR